MDKKILKILSFILAIVVTVTSLPMTAFASAMPEGTDEEVNVTEREKAIIEMVDMRTATAKYFRLDDGSYYVAQYDSNVHYKDDNGDWQDISAQFETADTTIVYVHIESLSKENYFDNLKLPEYSEDTKTNIQNFKQISYFNIV